MSENVGQLDVEIKLIDRGLRSGLDQAKSKLQETGGAAGGLAGKIQGLSSGFSTLSGVISGFTTASAVTAIAGIGVACIKSAADMEQLKISFEVMTGSAITANQLLGELKTFANTTPFETEGLARNASTLMSFGIELKNVLPSLKMLGDVAAGDQNKLDSLVLVFSQVQSASKLTGQDLLQFINTGFNPLQIISEKTGISMSELKKKMEQGAISADMITQAFKDATSEGGRFYNMTDKQGQSFNGLMSSAKDGVSNLATAFGDELMPKSKKALSLVIDLLDKVNKATLKIKESVSSDVKDSIFDSAFKAALNNPFLSIGYDFINQYDPNQKNNNKNTQKTKGKDAETQNDNKGVYSSLFEDSKSGAGSKSFKVAQGIITSRFGEDRGGRKHQGVDIAGKLGSPVKAAKGGVVIYTGTMAGYGNIVIVDHGDGLQTKYGHLASILTQKGAIVSASTQIGTMGSTGKSTGVHLHLEALKNGKAIDPTFLLTGSGGSGGKAPKTKKDNKYENALVYESNTIEDNIRYQDSLKPDLISKLQQRLNLRNEAIEDDKRKAEETEKWKTDISLGYTQMAIDAAKAKKEEEYLHYANMHEMSIEEQKNKELELIDFKYEQDLKYWEEKLKTVQKGSEEEARIQLEIAKLTAQKKQDIDKAENAAKEEQAEISRRYTDIVKEHLKGMVEQALDGNLKIGESFRQLGKKIISSFVNNAIDGLFRRLFNNQSGGQSNAMPSGIGVGSIVSTGLSLAGKLFGGKAIQGFSFSTGGIVPGSFSQPQPVLAHGSEMILNPSQQSNLFRQLNSQGNARQSKDNIQSQPVQQTIVYSPNVQTAITKEEVMGILQTNMREFSQMIATMPQNYQHVRTAYNV